MADDSDTAAEQQVNIEYLTWWTLLHYTKDTHVSIYICNRRNETSLETSNPDNSSGLVAHS